MAEFRPSNAGSAKPGRQRSGTAATERDAATAAEMEPLGSLQLRTNYDANKRIEMQWVELVTPRKTVKYGAFTHYRPNRM